MQQNTLNGDSRMANIIEFLEARIAEDEAMAKAATPGPWERPLNTRWKSFVSAEMPKGDPASRWKDNVDHRGEVERVGVVSCPIWSGGKFVRPQSGRDLEHIARHNPARILAECASKRAALEVSVNWDGYTRNISLLRALAFAYNHHPDYQQEWAL